AWTTRGVNSRPDSQSFSTGTAIRGGKLYARGFGNSMSSKISIGPPQLALHQANSVLVTQPDGQIRWPSKKGFYFLDTRVISAWQNLLDGGPRGAAQLGGDHALRGAYFPDQPRRSHAGRQDQTADGRADFEPLDQRRHARGSGYRQSRYGAGLLHTRNRDPVR